MFDHMPVTDLSQLRQALRAHYAGQLAKKGQRHPIEEKLDAYAAAHPDMSALQLKAAQYRILAENIKIVLADESPFYFMNDYCHGYQAGFPFDSAGGWLLRHREHLIHDANPIAHDRYEGMKQSLLFTGSHMYFDCMHYCYPITNVVKHGLRFYYEKAQSALPLCQDKQEQDFIRCVLAGLEAAKLIAEKFGQAAAERAALLSDPRQKRFMEMIASAAPCVPWEAPRHFCEGLNTLWFCRDLMGEIEGIGNSHLGRPDLLLYDLYKKDLEEGYITREEAYDLIQRWLQHGDCQYDKDSQVLLQNDHELEMGYILGGYDTEGNDVFNEVTTLFIRAHRAQKLIYPKAHYRFTKASCDAYLEDIAHDFLIGRSIGGLVNDDAIIPALVHAGKTPEDARAYINYGCWGIVTECMENTTGGNFIHTLSVLEKTIYGADEISIKNGVRFDSIDQAQSFEEVYQIFYGNLIRIIRDRLQIIGNYGHIGAEINPIPLYSAFTDGCIENRRDCLAGGSKYTINSFSLAEIANTVDALLAIKTLCFDQKIISLPTFLNIVCNNWENQEPLRQSLHQCPHFGDAGVESMALAKRLFDDVYHDTRDLKNEFGTQYMIDLFVYQEFRFHAERMRATPDGRKNGDIVALGVNPSRFHSDSIPNVLRSITSIDPVLSENHSLTLQLPAAKMTKKRLTALLRTAQAMQMKHIQINCVDASTLLDAQIHPENH